MGKTNLLSIVTICYNNKKGLEITSNSIINQTSNNYEWIIIDGGSTDGSCEIIKKNESYITYWVSEKDQGIYNALNKGIQHSKGKYIIFMNSGDYFYDNKIVEEITPLLNETDIYIGDIIVTTQNGQKHISIPALKKPIDIADQLILSGFPHQSCFIKKQLFVDYGTYREDIKIVADWYHFYRACVLGRASVEKIDKIISYYDGNGISSNCKEINKERIKALEEYPVQQALFSYYLVTSDYTKAFNSHYIFRLIRKIIYYLYCRSNRQ